MGHQFEVLSKEIIGAALAVHRELGPGFLEAIYHSAMVIALRRRGIPFETQMPISIVFEGEAAGIHRLDLVVRNEIVVELKSVNAFSELHEKQLLSYLKASKLRIGLLLNFNAPVLAIRRVVN